MHSLCDVWHPGSARPRCNAPDGPDAPAILFRPALQLLFSLLLHYLNAFLGFLALGVGGRGGSPYIYIYIYYIYILYIYILYIYIHACVCVCVCVVPKDRQLSVDMILVESMLSMFFWGYGMDFLPGRSRIFDGATRVRKIWGSKPIPVYGLAFQRSLNSMLAPQSTPNRRFFRCWTNSRLHKNSRCHPWVWPLKSHRISFYLGRIFLILIPKFRTGRSMDSLRTTPLKSSWKSPMVCFCRLGSLWSSPDKIIWYQMGKNLRISSGDDPTLLHWAVFF